MLKALQKVGWVRIQGLRQLHQNRKGYPTSALFDESDVTTGQSEFLRQSRLGDALPLTHGLKIGSEFAVKGVFFGRSHNNQYRRGLAKLRL